MSSSNTNKNSADRPKPLLTNEGLPIDHSRFGTAITTTSVAEGPMRRVSVGNAASFYAPTKKAGLAPLTKAPITSSVKSTAAAVEDNDALAPTNLSPKSQGPGVGGRWQNKRSHPFRSSLLDEEEVDDLLAPESSLQRPSWSSQLYNIFALPILPSVNHPLEKTSVTVKGVAPSIIATRICDTLQRRSIAASYPSPHKVNCVSSAHVEFCIFLYRQGNSEQDGITVEVQLRDGFVVSYMTDVYAILDAASGNEDVGDVSQPMYFEESSDDGEEYQVPPLLSQTFKKENEPSVEEVSLCLSSLASLTNEDKVGPTAIQMSRQFLVSDECKELRSKVLSLIEVSNESSISRSTLQSLEILANVCNCATGSSKVLGPILSSHDSELQSLLVAHLENAQNNPMAAAYCCSIFRRLAEEQSLTFDISSSLSAALFNAVSLGGEIHAELERQAGSCLSVMST